MDTGCVGRFQEMGLVALMSGSTSHTLDISDIPDIPNVRDVWDVSAADTGCVLWCDLSPCQGVIYGLNRRQASEPAPEVLEALTGLLRELMEHTAVGR